MGRASITDGKNHLSGVLDRVRAGETVLITDRGVAVASIGPVAEPVDADRLHALMRQGVVRAPRRPLAVDAFLRLPRPRLTGVYSLVRAVAEDREDSA